METEQKNRKAPLDDIKKMKRDSSSPSLKIAKQGSITPTGRSSIMSLNRQAETPISAVSFWGPAASMNINANDSVS